MAGRIRTHTVEFFLPLPRLFGMYPAAIHLLLVRNLGKHKWSNRNCQQQHESSF